MAFSCWILALDELRRIARSRLAVLTLVVLWLATLTATCVGWKGYADRQASHLAAVQTKVEDQLRTRTPAGRSIDPGLRVLRPSPLGVVLVEGSEPLLPSGWDFGPAGPVSLARYQDFRSQLGGVSNWDLGHVVILLGSLAALAAGLGSVGAHRYSGWARAIGGLQTSHVQQATGQLAGGHLLVGLVTVVLAGAQLAVLQLLGLGSLTDDVLLITPIVWLSLCTFYSAGVAIASRVESPGLTWPVALSFWVLASAVGSSIPTVVANALYPVTPADTWHRFRADAFLQEVAAQEAPFVASLVAGVPSTTTELELDAASEKQFALMDGEWQSRMRTVRRAVSRLESERRAQIDRNRRTGSRLTHFFPAAASYAAMAEVVGTGQTVAFAFDDAVWQHQQDLSAALFDDRPAVNLRVSFGTGQYELRFDRHPSPQYSALPKFTPPGSDGRGEVSAPAPYVLSLLVWFLATTALAVTSRARMARDLSNAS